MSDSSRSIYSLTIGGVDCRCAGELISMKVLQVEGVEAASLGSDDVLTVFADSAITTVDDIVRAVVDAGFLPADTVEVGDVTARGVADVRVITVEVEPDTAAEVAFETTAADFGPAAIVEVEKAAVAEELPGETAEEPEPVPAAESVFDETVFATDGWSEPVAASASAAPAPAAAEAPSAELEYHHEAVTAVATASSPLKGVAETEPVAAFARARLVQRLDVAVSDGYYPAHLVVQANVPVEIGFGEGNGCLAHVLFEDFGIDADLTDGGATVRLPGLAEGTYRFSCGMNMVFGTVEAVA